jgi:hypothetical protein
VADGRPTLTAVPPARIVGSVVTRSGSNDADSATGRRSDARRPASRACLQAAKFRIVASVEDVDLRASRGFDRATVFDLAA